MMQEMVVAAYNAVGVEVEKLPYTTDFDKLVKMLYPETRSETTKYLVYQTLLRLKKAGVL